MLNKQSIILVRSLKTRRASRI